MKPGLAKLFFGILVFVSTQVTTLAQIGSAGPLGGPQRIPGVEPGGYGSIMVYVRTDDGTPLPENALPMITLTSRSSDAPLPYRPQLDGNGWTFSGLPIDNEYEVLVKAIGYQPKTEVVELPDVTGASSSVIVFLKPQNQDLLFRPPNGKFVLAPNAQKEIQRALQDLQQNKMSSAQKHAEKALQLAPGNPYVQYVMGMTYVLSKQSDRAKPFLEKSVSIDPSQPVALGALGAVRFEQGDDAGATEVLTKAVQLDPSSWKDEWYLACSYLRQKKYVESAAHAEKALKTGKEKAHLAKIVLGEAQADLGQREKAIATFEAFVEETPKDPNTKDVLRWIELLRHPPAAREKSAAIAPVSSSGSPEFLTMSLPLPPVEVPPREDWAPRDIDAVKPFVIASASCSLPKILDTAAKNAEALVQNLQEFSATEEFQSIEIKRTGALERPAAHEFNYLVFIDQVSPERFDVREVRGADTSAKSPDGLADMGAPALALAFHPSLRDDFDWTCEGLGQWNERPAWIIHFKQRPDRPDVLAWFADGPRQYPMPLKGRAWLSERDGQVLHLDTDLVTEIEPVHLKREHFSVDYKQVSFRAHKMELWLPVSVDTYIQYQGHFLHHYHHYSDFKLFWVGASQKISDPKSVGAQEQ